MAPRQNFESLFMQAPALVAILEGPEGVCTLFNHMFAKLWGGRDVLNKTMREAWPDLEGQGWFEIREEVYRTGKAIYGTEQPALADWDNNGQLREIFFNHTYSPLFDENGNVTAVMIFGYDVTESVHARLNAEEKEECLRIAIEGGELGTFDFFPGSEKLVLSQKTKALFGIPETNEPDYATFLSGLHPDDQLRAQALYAKIVEPGNSDRYSNEFRTIGITDGKQRWGRFEGRITADGDGNPVRFSGIVQDITDKKVAEEKLAYRSAILEAHNRASLDGLLLVDEQGKIISYNPRFLEIWDMPIGIVESKNDDVLLQFAMTQLIHPEQFLARVHHVYAHHAHVTDELDFKNGKIVERTGYPVIGENGQYYAWSWTFRDVTKQRKYEREISESEERFRTLAETLPQLIWITDTHGKRIYASSRWESYTGIKPDGEESFREMVHPDDWPVIGKAWSESLATGSLYKTEVRMRDRSGNYRWHFVHGEPLRDEENNVLQWIGAFTDIHDQKVIEEKLEDLVTDRTLALERSNQDLQQFAHVASHDLKEPLRKIKTFANRLENEYGTAMPERLQSYLTKIQSATTRMQAMIDGVLTYSSVDGVEQKLETVDLNQVLQYVRTDLELLINQQQVSIQSEPLPHVQGSEILLYQLFYNLINNAIKFSQPDKAASIDISAKIVMENGQDWCTIRVQDNGIGFEPAFAEKIFDTFTRLHSKDLYEGTGLGLALCKKIVLRHNGFIRAVSTLGEGSAFTIFLPAT